VNTDYRHPMPVLSPSLLRSLRRGSMFAAMLLLLTIPIVVFGADENLVTVGTTADLGSADLMTIIGKIIAVVLSVLGVIFLILLIYAGAIWMTAGGDGKKVDKAKSILINAVVGLVLTISAYAISTFVLNLLGSSTNGTGSGSTSGSVSVERLSNSLGSGAIRDHYPARSATDVSRNTRIFVTFRDAMDPESFIDGYDTNGTADDVSDDTVATAIKSDMVKIYVRDSGDTTALTDVAVSFTDDLKTFVFDPAEYLGSSTANVTYAVYLSDAITSAAGETVIDDGGYIWYFTTGTTIDITPPTVTSVTPVDGSTKDRNIAVQVNFSEAVDPVSATGVRDTESGFSNIQIVGETSVAPVAGTYAIGNNYQSVTFTSATACGTNSCGETMYCLPGGETITATVFSATPTSSTDPVSSVFPYDGVVDTSGNALDGNEDGAVGTDDDYTWSFSTTDNINYDIPVIESISPDLREENVSLDRDITLTFDSILQASTATSSNIALSNKELKTGDDHELWYTFGVDQYTLDHQLVAAASQIPAYSVVTITHGTFLASDPSTNVSYMYGITASQGVKNEYQNCFVPGMGPNVTGATCDPNNASSSCCAVDADTPYCCNGAEQSAACTLF
jgi:hypothetical protein